MIALVNDEQQEALRLAEVTADHCNHKVEYDKEQLIDLNNLLDVASMLQPDIVLAVIGMEFFLSIMIKKLR